MGFEKLRPNAVVLVSSYPLTLSTGAPLPVSREPRIPHCLLGKYHFLNTYFVSDAIGLTPHTQESSEREKGHGDMCWTLTMDCRPCCAL